MRNQNLESAAKAFEFWLYELKNALKERPTSHYIWRTRGDGKVRNSHAANDGQIFSWDNPPPTGHPGEDYGCRCWAEPIGSDQYANQLLITPINDNPDKWGNLDFWNHYTARSGLMITLEESGYLQDVINYFANNVITSNGSKGGYQAVEKQIIIRAQEVERGVIYYNFDSPYKFGDFWDLVLGNGFFSLGHSSVSGIFNGNVRKEKEGEKEYLVINGIITYNFEDEFKDPYDKVEITQLLYGVSREEAEAIVGDTADEDGKPYDIKGNWQTKLNSTVRAR